MALHNQRLLKRRCISKRFSMCTVFFHTQKDIDMKKEEFGEEA